MQFEMIRNDITNMSVDAIVLPANLRLKEGSGTSKAIYERAGRKELEKACKAALKEYGKIYIGGSVPTLAFNLNADFIIHAVVPKWIDGQHQEYDLLSSAYLSALDLADMMSCESIAFPLLAAGNNGFDLQLAFEIAKESIEAFKPTNKLERVILVLYSAKSMAIVREQGMTIEAAIDDKYILKNNEQWKSPAQEALDGGKEIAVKFLENGQQMVKEYLDDPENRKKILAAGVGIAKVAFKAVKK